MSDQREANGLSPLQWTAVALVATTGILHVYAGFIEGRIPVLLAGVGYGGALVLFALDYRRRLLYLVGIPYTLVQIPLWYVANAGEFTVVGYADKATQVLLVLTLVYLYWRERSLAAASSTPTA
ncbi:hypothetical protein [Salinibaculum rarum]|uniref:hypothetical protein n=1 Tax=Salinibaculum rarum TaxID=3058903 RepID=UPI00265E4390|nr:hypothetical protein [Salinibaculum sp. KK48]